MLAIWKGCPADTEGNFGLVRNPYNAGQKPVYTPKPAYLATQTFLDTLGQYRFDRVAPVPGSSGGLLFTFSKHHDHRYAVYTTSSQPESVTLNLRSGKYSLISLLGDSNKPVAVGSDGLTITLSGATQFIESKK